MSRGIVSPDGTQVWDGEKWVPIGTEKQQPLLTPIPDPGIVVHTCNDCKIMNDRKPAAFKGYMKCANCLAKEQMMKTQETRYPAPQTIPNQITQPILHTMQPMQETAPPLMVIATQNSRKPLARNMKIIFAIFGVSSVLLLATILSIAGQEDEYTLEYSRATAYIYIDSIEVDNGEANRMFEVDVFYDERNRYEFRTGDECDALEYYDSARTYYLEEFCVINYADPFVDKVTFGACAQYVASDRYYDISSSSNYNSGCVKAEASIVNPTLNPSYGLEDDCSYDGELIDDDLSLAKFVSFSGFDDGDSNSYNADIDFTLSFVLTYECKI